MKKQLTYIIIVLGLSTGAIAFTTFISNNDVTRCESCNKSHCIQKVVPVSATSMISQY